MSITARELARQLGLSEATVSLALNNKPGISAETRRIVIEAATRQGYNFRRIKSKRLQNNGRVCMLAGPYSQSEQYGKANLDDIVEGARTTCKERRLRFDLMRLCTKQLGGDGLEGILMELRQLEPDAMLVLGADMPRNAIEALLSLDIPMVLVDTYFPDLPCSAVTIDNTAGGRLAAQYLCDTYQQEPWYLKCRFGTRNFDDRINGFMSAVRDRAFSYRRVRVIYLSPTIEGSCLDLTAYIEAESSIPRCVFAETDQLALGAIRAFASRGLRIPEDVAVAGFDNTALARTSEPPLTTIDYPKSFMGVLATRKLLDLIEHPMDYVTNIQIATSLVIRGSA